VIRLHRLVDDLHQLTLSDLGALTYRKEDLELADVLADSADAYRAEFARKGITLTTDLPQGREAGTGVFADKERLQQLFSNLFGNSLKYTEKGGKLVVRLRCSGGRATIDFEDSAPGVPGEDLEKLFDRLYRVETSRSRVSGGAGLGLPICRNIVEAHGGSITAHASSLGGLLMRISLPLEEDAP
jgi:two-component system sensor histidine kinase BaeS